MGREPLRGGARRAAASFGLTIFLSAFLLFWVQLLLAKYILPWFGGTPAVWTTCMLFFQVGLLGGYAYAHVISSRLRPRAQATLHAGLIAACVLLMSWLSLKWGSPITPGPNWKPSGDQPVWQIVVLLGASAGLPYFILSATGPLLQAWFGRTHPGRSPYRLYALSNFGSFLALLSYPFLLEPSLTLKAQARLWWWAYVCFAAACGYCALRVGGAGAGEKAPAASPAGEDEVRRSLTRPRAGTYALWLSLAACASVIFLATTNQICQDIGVVPLLWVLPLGLYLLSFVVCFEKEGWYSRRWFHPLLGAAIFGACYVKYDGALGSIRTQIAIYAFVLFVCCMVCHGELVRSKPHPRYLTSFYLTVAAGGALGGVLVTLVAPHVFKGFWEYPLGLWLCVLLALVIVVRDRESWLYQSRLASPVVVVAVASLLPEAGSLATVQTGNALVHLPLLTALILVGYVFLNRNRAGSQKARRQAGPVYCAAAWLLMGTTLLGSITANTRTAVWLGRNFYGVLGVFPRNPDNPERAAYVLKHGRIVHGVQFVAAGKRRLPTSYYGPASGIGLAIAENPRRLGPEGARTLRVGGVGLGAGTIAAYGQTGDLFRFYEINPEVIRIAGVGPYFSYLKDCRARVEVVPGDARLSMERELSRGEAQNFDVLAIDAFSGDAIPVHLLTEEAFRIYLKQLRGPQAILAIHITNTNLDLRPVVVKLAERFGLRSAWVSSPGDGETVSPSEWMLLSGSNSLVAGAAAAAPPMRMAPRESRLWTDDYSNLFQVLRR